MNMKVLMFSVLLLTIPVVGMADNKDVIQTDDGVTFVVDKNLSTIKDRRDYSPTRYFNNKEIIATSLTNEQNLKDLGKDAFYQCVVRAYANHQSLTFSPDMIWLLISQGFSRYVNAHAEELRPMIVSHDGKQELTVESTKELLTEQADWDVIVDSFALKIGDYTKDGIAETITADFTTTGTTERIASQITLMESLKSYFYYTVVYAGCGIPSITLKGTPDDWRRVFEKAIQLERYGLGDWISQLRPVLAEFIKASEGNPDRKFWKQMVKKKRIGKFKGALCTPQKPTLIDGWILTLFPDNDGVVKKNIPFTNDMPASMVYVGFEYRIIDRAMGSVLKKTPLELWAGFIGVEEDKSKNMLTPKIGWYVSFEGDK